MNFDFLPFKNNQIPEKNNELKPYIKNTLERIKHGDFTKKEQGILAAILIAATCGIGYGAFIHAPLEQQAALKSALQSQSVVHAQEAGGASVKESKAILNETDVERALADDIASDPNVAIASEEVVKSTEDSGNLNLVVEHSGAHETLTQYIETLEGLQYQVNIDSISYRKDPSNMESTSIRLSVPYKIIDNSLESSHMASASSGAISTPETTATPSDQSSSSGGYSSSSSSSSTSTWSPSRTTPSTTITPSTSSTTKTQSKPSTTKPKETKKPQTQVKPQGEKPPLSSETVYLAPPITRYSAKDGILGVQSYDDLDVQLLPETDGNVQKDKQIVSLQFKTPEGLEGEREAVNREIFLNTGGFYLPKNGYEMSIDVANNTGIDLQYILALSDLAGNTKEVLPVRTTDLGDGFSRIFFPLNGMDGTVRATQIRVKFVDTKAIDANIAFRNIQILSHEK